MIPQVGTTCYFALITKFSSLDGVYRVKAETTFADAVKTGLNFVDNLYIPAGLTQVDYNTDYSSYANDRIVVLESVTDNQTVIYVPESALRLVPDPTIREYFPLNLVVNLGAHRNTQVVLPLLDQIKDLIQSALGIENPLYLLSNPQNKVYLTDAQYDTLVQAREANITRLTPFATQLHQKDLEIVDLQARIQAYETLIKQLSQP